MQVRVAALEASYHGTHAHARAHAHTHTAAISAFCCRSYGDVVDESEEFEDTQDDRKDDDGAGKKTSEFDMYNRGFDDAQALSSSPEQCISGKHGHSTATCPSRKGGASC